MRPRIAFATIFALGAGAHLLVLIDPPRHVGYLAVYLCWLLPSIAFAGFVWAKSSPPRPRSAWERRMRQDSPGLWMEGLGLFVGIATVGLVIHLFGPYKGSYAWPHPGPYGKSEWTQFRAMSLMLVLCAAGCWGLLRGEPGDTAAPLPDGSRLVRAGGWLRRLAGAGLGCWGAWLFVLGMQRWGQAADGVDRLMTLMFVVGGPFWLLIGLALALRRGRSDAMRKGKDRKMESDTPA